MKLQRVGENFEKTFDAYVPDSEPLIDFKIGDASLHHFLHNDLLYYLSKKGTYRVSLKIERIGDLPKPTS